VTEVKITTCIPRPWTPPATLQPSRSSGTLHNQALYPGQDPEIPDAALIESASQPRFETTCTSTAAAGPSQTTLTTSERKRPSGFAKFRAKLKNLDPIKLAYLRTSFVFAISILVTWTPSSVNRIHNLVHPFAPNYGLNVASAVVLPLQGVWNAVIFFSTSWGMFREEMGKTRVVRRIRGSEVSRRMFGASQTDMVRIEGVVGDGDGESEGQRLGVMAAMEMGRLGVPPLGTVRAIRGSF